MCWPDETGSAVGEKYPSAGQRRPRSGTAMSIQGLIYSWWCGQAAGAGAKLGLIKQIQSSERVQKPP